MITLYYAFHSEIPFQYRKVDVYNTGKVIIARKDGFLVGLSPDRVFVDYASYSDILTVPCQRSNASLETYDRRIQLKQILEFQ